MPISRDEFEQGRIDLTLPIARLLAGIPDLAFTADEIQQMLIEVEARNATLEEVLGALEALLSQGKIQRKEVQGSSEEWYAIVRQRLGFLKE